MTPYPEGCRHSKPKNQALSLSCHATLQAHDTVNGILAQLGLDPPLMAAETGHNAGQLAAILRGHKLLKLQADPPLPLSSTSDSSSVSSEQLHKDLRGIVRAVRTLATGHFVQIVRPNFGELI